MYSPVEEGVSEGVELAEGFVGIHYEGVSRNEPLHVSMHDSGEAVSGGLRPYTTPWDVLFQQIPVLTEQNHGYCVEMIIYNNLVVFLL